MRIGSVNEVVILAGGLGTRLKEETSSKPKPMVNVGTNPILIEITSHFLKYGCTRIIVCGGYKIEYIRKYFLESNITRGHFSEEGRDIFSIVLEENQAELTLVDTGIDTPTGGRLKKIEKEINSKKFFCTYGDGLSNIDLFELEKLQNRNKSIATLTAVKPPSRFGVLAINELGEVVEFLEKPRDTWVNGGFFLFSNEIFDFLKLDSTLEVNLLPSLAIQSQLSAFKHDGFWYSMDTLRDYELLNELAKETPPPWK